MNLHPWLGSSSQLLVWSFTLLLTHGHVLSFCCSAEQAACGNAPLETHQHKTLHPSYHVHLPQLNSSCYYISFSPSFPVSARNSSQFALLSSKLFSYEFCSFFICLFSRALLSCTTQNNLNYRCAKKQSFDPHLPLGFFFFWLAIHVTLLIPGVFTNPSSKIFLNPKLSTQN